MPSTSFVDKLRLAYPQFIFQNASVSRWSPREQTVFYHSSRSQSGKIDILHELGHAIRQHHSYDQDIELLRYEREAWETAQQIAPTYNVLIPDTYIENHLDTYRDWMHARSRCPSCHQGGIQGVNLQYSCILCATVWNANDARQCGLKRYTNK